MKNLKTNQIPMEEQKMNMDLYDEMISDLHTKYKIFEHGVTGIDFWKDIEKYLDDRSVMKEMIEQITNTLNCKVDEVEHLKKENQDLDIELGRIPHLKEEVRETKEENERLEMAMIDMNDNWCESILYEIGLGGKNVRERLNSIRLLENEVEILKFQLQKEEETHQQIVRDIGGVYLDDVSLRWIVGEEV